MTDPERERRRREDSSIHRLSWIAAVLAAVVLILGAIYNRPVPAPEAAKVFEAVTRDN